MNEKRRKWPYDAWPEDAAKLNRRCHQYEIGGITRNPVWAKLSNQKAKFDWVQLTLKAVGGAPYLVISTTDTWPPRWGNYKARHALAWLLLKRLLPFEVPAAFAAAIREDFEADAPWLILADWLEEQGQPEHAAHLRAAVERSARGGVSLTQAPK